MGSRFTSRFIRVKVFTARGKEETLKAIREKLHATQKGTPGRLIANFSSSHQKPGRAEGSDIQQNYLSKVKVK